MDEKLRDDDDYKAYKLRRKREKREGVGKWGRRGAITFEQNDEKVLRSRAREISTQQTKHIVLTSKIV